MKANELRINNLVLTSDGITKVSDVVEFGINMIHDCWEHDLEDVNPIPLTKEWLVKFGFVNTESLDYLLDTWLSVDGYSVHYNFDNWRLRNSNAMDWTEIPTEIKHVHQLQNLYFALTGEELTIEL